MECQANAQSGWNYSEEDSSVVSEVISADGQTATVKADVEFKGGNPPTFMGMQKTFSLILESGDWGLENIWDRSQASPNRAGNPAPLSEIEPTAPHRVGMGTKPKSGQRRKSPAVVLYTCRQRQLAIRRSRDEIQLPRTRMCRHPGDDQ
jgi:hypothetical protein